MAIMTTMISNSNRTEITIVTTTDVGNDAGSGRIVPVGLDSTDVDERWLFPARRIQERSDYYVLNMQHIICLRDSCQSCSPFPCMDC